MIAAAILQMALSGCSSSRPALIYSNPPQPERSVNSSVFIPKCSRQLAFDSAVDRCVPLGWRITETNPYQITLESDADRHSQLLAEFNYNGRAIYRLSLRGVEADSGTTLHGNLSLLAVAESTREVVTTLKGKKRAKLAKELQRLLEISKQDALLRLRSG